MSNNQNKSPQFMLGEMYSDIKWLREAEETRQKTDEDHEARLTSLEQTRFKLFTIVSTVAAAVGFLFSNLKDGVEWLTSKMA